MKPRARKKASAISQGISDENALKAAAKGNRPVTMETPRPIIAVAPREEAARSKDRGRASAADIERAKYLPRRGGKILTETDLGLGRRVGDARW